MYIKSNKKSFSLMVLFFLLFVGVFFNSHVDVDAAQSTQWGDVYNGVFFWETWGDDYHYQRWNNSYASVTYNARVTDVDSNFELEDGAVISIGTRLLFEAVPYEDTDIYFNGTGGMWDTPYGSWIDDAGSPPSSLTCSPSNLVTTLDYQRQGAHISERDFDIYGSLSVDPPPVTITHSGTAGLSCNASNTSCTVTSAGTIDSVFNFQPTFGKFYGGERVHGYPSGGGSWQAGGWPLKPPTASGYSLNKAEWCSGGCINFGVDGTYCFPPTTEDPLILGLESLYQQIFGLPLPAGYCVSQCSTSGTPLVYNNQIWPIPTSASQSEEFTLDVPLETINFSFTVAGAGNNPPGAPTITSTQGLTGLPAITTGLVGVPYVFRFTATDPDGDTIKYEIDWTNDGTVDGWLPFAGYVNSNTSRLASHVWTTPGAKTFQARTWDNKAASSTWTQHTITITVPAPVVTLTGVEQNPPFTLETNSLFKKLLSWIGSLFLQPTTHAGGSFTITAGKGALLTWTVTPSATSCTGSMTQGTHLGWLGAKNVSGGTYSTGALSAGTYVFRLACDNQGVTGPNSSDTVQVTVNGIPGGICGDGTENIGEACDDGNTLNGDTCSSDCLTDTIPANSPPNPPTINGPLEGYVDTPYEFDFTATDIDGDMVRYIILTGWTAVSTPVPPGSPPPYVPSGTTASASRAWTSTGTHSFQARTRANNNMNSGPTWFSINIIALPPVIPPAGNDACTNQVDDDNDGYCDLNPTRGGMCTDGSIPGDPGCINPVTPGVISENNCGNNICEAFVGENPIRCPRDCKVKEEGEL